MQLLEGRIFKNLHLNLGEKETDGEQLYNSNVVLEIRNLTPQH